MRKASHGWNSLAVPRKVSAILPAKETAEENVLVRQMLGTHTHQKQWQ